MRPLWAELMSRFPPRAAFSALKTSPGARAYYDELRARSTAPVTHIPVHKR